MKHPAALVLLCALAIPSPATATTPTKWDLHATNAIVNYARTAGQGKPYQLTRCRHTSTHRFVCYLTVWIDPGAYWQWPVAITTNPDCLDGMLANSTGPDAMRADRRWKHLYCVKAPSARTG